VRSWEETAERLLLPAEVTLVSSGGGIQADACVGRRVASASLVVVDRYGLARACFGGAMRSEDRDETLAIGRLPRYPMRHRVRLCLSGCQVAPRTYGGTPNEEHRSAHPPYGARLSFQRSSGCSAFSTNGGKYCTGSRAPKAQ